MSAPIRLLGRYIGKVVQMNSSSRAARVSVVTMKLEPNIHVYYNTEEQYWASDPDLNCKVGDFVLIGQLEKPLSVEIGHEVMETVFPAGHVIDPVTGRRCRGVKYLDLERRTFNKLPTASTQ